MAKQLYLVSGMQLSRKSKLNIPNVSEIEINDHLCKKHIFFHCRITKAITVYVVALSLVVEEVSKLLPLKQKFKALHARLCCILNNQANKTINLKSNQSN